MIYFKVQIDMKKMFVIHRFDLLLNPIFLTNLIVLILNDLVFKAQFSNFLTGKLSDICGLFVFPFFLSTINIKYTKCFYIFSCIIFTFWKLPISQQLIYTMNQTGISLSRTIDYTDFVALLILPISFRYFTFQTNKIANTKIHTLTILIVSVISIFSFCFTTLGETLINVNIETNKEFYIKQRKIIFFKKLTAAHPYSQMDSQNLLNNDLFYLTFEVKELNGQCTVMAKIEDFDTSRTRIILLKIKKIKIYKSLIRSNEKQIKKVASLSKNDWESYFLKYFIQNIDKNTSDMYYDIKELADKNVKK